MQRLIHGLLAVLLLLLAGLALADDGEAFRITSIQEESWDNGAAIVMRFSVPLDPESDWRSTLRISRRLIPLPADDWVLTDNGRTVVYPFVDPEITYTVQAQGRLQAATGQQLSLSIRKAIETRARPASASFAGRGYVLSSELRRALPISTLNVDRVDLDIFRIAPEAIGAWSLYTRVQRNWLYSMQDFTAEHPLVYSGRFDIRHQRNQRTITNLDLSDIRELDVPGAYFAVLRLPGRYEYELETRFFTVSDIGVQVRVNDRRLRVNTHSISGGQPLAGVTVSLYDEQTLIARQSVDADGEAEFVGVHQSGQTLVAQRDGMLTVLRYDRDALDLSNHDNVRVRHQPTQVFSWGARDLYRPGETLSVHALVRDYDGRAIDPLPMRLVLNDATATKVLDRIVRPDASGRYSSDYRLPRSASTGSWRVDWYLPGGEQSLGGHPVQVEDFLPERLELQVFGGIDDPYRRVSSREQIRIPLEARTLVGQPASRAAVDGFVIAEADPHPFEHLSGFRFGLDGETIPRPRQSLPRMRLDADGRLDVDIPVSAWNAVRSPLALVASLSVYETGGRPVTRRVNVTNILSDRLVGVEPQFQGNPASDSRASFKAVLTDADGQLLEGAGYRLQLLRESRNYFWRFSEARGWHWDYEPIEYEVHADTLQFDGRSATDLVVPLEWGDYRLEVRAPDGTLLNRFRFTTDWSGWASLDTASLRPDQVLMRFDRDRYQPGDTARLTLLPPVDGQAHVTVEHADQVLWSQWLPVVAAGTEIRIETGDDWDRHDIHVTATVLSPGDMVHTVAPKRAFGFAHLPLIRDDAELNLSLALPEDLQSRRTVVAEVQLENTEAQRAPVWVSLAAVDVGVLNITRYRTPDPLTGLFGARRYDDRLYDIYGDIIENAGYRLAAQRYGGGADASEAELLRGGEPPDADIAIVSLESRPVQLDPDGRARIALDLPDFNGRLRWMLMAWSETGVGHAEAETTVIDPITVRLSRPRFLALEDRSQLTLDLVNQTDQVETLDLTLSVGDALAEGQRKDRIRLEPGATGTLTYPIQAAALGQGSIRLDLANSDGDIRRGMDWSLGVRTAWPAISRSEQVVLQTGEIWQPDLMLDDLIDAATQGRLVLSNQPPIDVVTHFEELLAYPYGCSEQIISRAIPWALLSPEEAERFGLVPIIEERFETDYTASFQLQQLTGAVNDLLGRQQDNGGFGVWSRSGAEAHWLTVQAAEFLLAAVAAGVEVPAQALDRTLGRLDDYVRGDLGLPNQGPAAFFTVQAYAADVLSGANRVHLGHLRRLFQQGERLQAHSGLPWAHLARALSRAGDPSLADQAIQRARQQAYRGPVAGDYGSSLRDAAAMVSVLHSLERVRGSDLQALFEQLRDVDWLSTQERNALFQAALADPGGHSASTRVALTRDGEREIRNLEGPLFQRLSADDVRGLGPIEALEGLVYGRLELVGPTRSAPKAVSHGIGIERRYYTLEGLPTRPGSLRSGDLLLVELRAEADHRIDDALIVDLLPAGLELENQNLSQASADLEGLSIDGAPITGWQDDPAVVHTESRDDRFLAALRLQADRPVRVYYLARAVTPGTYVNPPPYIEDMYRPDTHAIGRSEPVIAVQP